MNAEFIRTELTPAERLKRLNDIAIHQLKTLTAHPGIKALDSPKEEE